MKTSTYDNPIIEKVKEDLDLPDEPEIFDGYTLSQAMREGSKVSGQAYSWGDDEDVCALSAAFMAGRARGYIEDDE